MVLKTTTLLNRQHDETYNKCNFVTSAAKMVVGPPRPVRSAAFFARPPHICSRLGFMPLVLTAAVVFFRVFVITGKERDAAGVQSEQAKGMKLKKNTSGVNPGKRNQAAPEGGGGLIVDITISIVTSLPLPPCLPVCNLDASIACEGCVAVKPRMVLPILHRAPVPPVLKT